MAQNAKLTETGGKMYDINLAAAGISGGTKGINAAEMLSDSYFLGGSGSPDDQGGKTPFGSESAGGAHIY